MTITYTDCSDLVITSTNLNLDNQSVTLAIKINCEKEYAINVPVDAEDYTVVPEDIEMKDFITDGIYGFTLTIVQEDGTTVIETECKFIDCVSSCTMVETFSNPSGCSDCLLKTLAFNALKVAEDCTTCNCNTMCTLFNTVFSKDCVTTTTNVTNCGCS